MWGRIGGFYTPLKWWLKFLCSCSLTTTDESSPA